MQGEYEAARPLYERALAIRERVLGPDHPEVAGTLNNLGNAWRDLGQPGRARELYVRAYGILQRAFPTGHPDLRLVAKNLHRVAPDLIVLSDGRIANFKTDD